MMRIRALAVVAVCGLLVGCGVIGGVQGSGNVISESRSISGFDSISLLGSGELEVDQNGTESLSITADDNILPLVVSEVQGKQLVLHVKAGTNISPTKRIVYKVGARNLVAISNAGDTLATAKGIHTDTLRLDIEGSGDISTSGTSDRLDVSIAGSGKYQGADLKSKTAKIKIAGSGDADLAVSDSLDIEIEGSGSVKYTGDPKVTQRVLGSGSISRQ